MNPLALAIINNPAAHQVDRKKKMTATIEVMADNLVKKETQQIVSKGTLTHQHFGYGMGRGRNSGD